MSKRSTFKPRSPQTHQGSDDQLPAEAPPPSEAEVEKAPSPPPPPTEPSEPVEGESQIITAQDGAPKQDSPKATPPPTAEDPNPTSHHPPPNDQPDAEAVEQGESIGKHVSVSWRFQSPAI